MDPLLAVGLGGGFSKRLKPVTSCWEFNVWLELRSTRVFFFPNIESQRMLTY